MTSVIGRFTQSAAGGQAGSSSVIFGADLTQEPVFVDGFVLPSRAFARMMLCLGEVVRLREGRQQRDHSAYQQWVRGEYLKELPAEQAAFSGEVRQLLEQRDRLSESVSQLAERTRNLLPEKDVFWQERQRFWRWLYTHNRQAWIVLDPIVSVQQDAIFFEAFSQDESVYARVRLPRECLATEAPMRAGTTNIDFSIALEREFARTRSYRPLRLTVGSDSVGVATDVSMLTERKIDLPDSWVRGLIEVQAALSLAPIQIELASGFVADIVASLQSERERSGPRALLFRLVPGQPISVEIQPWGTVLTDQTSRFEGDRRRDIRVWGRRRLGVLADLLPHASTVRVELLDDGMPTFWTLSIDGVTLTIGLSGWTSQDWAGRARFSAMVPASQAPKEALEAAAERLRDHITLSVDDLAEYLNLPPVEARAVLQGLCVAGQAMYDVEARMYRWRALFPQIQLDRTLDIGREERKGVEIFRSGQITIQIDTILQSGGRRVVAEVGDGDHIREVMIESDVDGRVTYAQCDCSHFRFHKLRQGPCRHIVAASLRGATQ